jgi:FkbM family methyltransferase
MNETTSEQSFSQFGEDVLVWKYFGDEAAGFFVDVGANDPEAVSQTFFLEKKGWSGILIEPQSACCERLRQIRTQSHVLQLACGSPEQRGKALLRLEGQLSRLTDTSSATEKCEEVQIMTLDEILDRTPHPQIDFLSIDVEGFELQVLQGFDLQKHSPRLILLEDNFPNRLQVHRHMKHHGYKLVKRTGCNNWYIPKGQTFTMTTTMEKAKLWRKMYLGTAFRKLRMFLTGH